MAFSVSVMSDVTESRVELMDDTGCKQTKQEVNEHTGSDVCSTQTKQEMGLKMGVWSLCLVFIGFVWSLGGENSDVMRSVYQSGLLVRRLRPFVSHSV